MRGSRLVGRLAIESGEGAIFAWGVLALFLVGWAEVSVKNVAETLFIKRVGVEWMPLVFLVNSLLLVGTTWIFGRWVTGRDRLLLLPLTLLGLGVVLLPIWWLVASELGPAFSLLMLASKHITSVALLVFWVAMGDLLHARQAKRLFAPLMAGVTLGTMAGSFASKPLGDWLGIEGLIPFSALVLAAGAAVALPLRGQRAARLRGGLASGRRRAERAQSESAARLGDLLRESGLFRLLFVPALCCGLLGPMLYFQFQYVADLATGVEGGENALLAFYAQFRGWISVGVLVTQLAVTANLYRRIGVPLSAALSPIVYFLGFVGLSLRLSLPAGVGASAGTKLADSAVYDPALRVLYNLFPEAIRAGVSSLLEGPVKRAGAAAGSAVVLAALAIGSARWVGYLALPVAAVWIVAALALWRSYPALLLRASARRERLGESELIDPATLRALGGELVSPDPDRCQLAIALVSEARPELAVAALARAASLAPDATRAHLVRALDRVLESRAAESVASPEAAAALATLLDDPARLAGEERADVVQAIGRLSAGPGRAEQAEAALERALADPLHAVRIAADAALCRRGQPPPGSDLDGVLAAALESDDELARRIAREELRAALLSSDPDERWGGRLTRLATQLARAADRAGAAEAIADVARRHGHHAVIAGAEMLRWRADPEPRVRAAVLRFAGFAGIQSEASWMVEHVASSDAAGGADLRAAASEGLVALGAKAADVLLLELSCGKRSTRDAILPIVGQLEVERETLRSLYGRELELVRRNLVHLAALQGDPRAAILCQRLEERVAEGAHTALLLLAAIHGEDRIGELSELLLRAEPRQRAILIEALEALLGASEKAQLIPLLEERPAEARGSWAAAALAIPIPDREHASRALLEDPDELTRALAAIHFGGPAPAPVAASTDVTDAPSVLSPVEIMLHLRSLPVFENLTTRQLMDLARLVGEESHRAGEVVVREGDTADCMYLIVDGEVEVRKGETPLRLLGPRSFFGEMAVFEGAERSATVVARTGVRLLGLKRDDLFRMMEELPGIAIAICRTMSRRVRELTDDVVGG